MAKKELLRNVVYKVLVILLVAGATRVLACSTVCSSDTDIREDAQVWATAMADESLQLMQKEVLANFKKLQQERKRMTDFNRIINPSAELRVFVSSSMSLQTLKSYYRNCARYNGIMVFKGLPDGSFQKLYKLIGQITGSNNSNKPEVALQMDDEVFARFGVNHVPAIVLSKESNCLFKQSCQIVFDKVTGNIGIKRALEEFASSGDLQPEAQRLLKAE